MADGLSLGIDAARPLLKLDAAAHEEHIEIVERDRNVLQGASRREGRIPGDQLNLRIDMLIGDEDIHGCRVDRLIDGEVPFGGLRGCDFGLERDAGEGASGDLAVPHRVGGRRAR